MKLILLLSLLLVQFGNPPISPSNAGQVEELYYFQIDGAFANAIAFSPAENESEFLAIAQSDGILSIWTASGDLLDSWHAHQEAVNDIAWTFFSDTWYLVTTGNDGNVIVWDSTADIEIQTMTVPERIPVKLSTGAGSLIAVGYDDGSVRLWDAETGEQYVTLYGYDAPVFAIDIAPDNAYLAFGYSFGSVFLYKLVDLENQRIFIVEVLDAGELNDLEFPPNYLQPPLFDYPAIATASNWDSIMLWNIYEIEPTTRETNSNMSYPDALSFNRNGKLLAVAGQVGAAGGVCRANWCGSEIIRTRFNGESQVITRLESSTLYPFTDIDFSSDDRFLATSTTDGLITVWGITQ